MSHAPEPRIDTSVSDRIHMCIIACAGMDDPVKEIALLRANNQTLVDALDAMEAALKKFQGMIRIMEWIQQEEL